MFARQVYERSARRNGPFVAVNCAAMREGLIESELFGYGEGAFTGAKRKGSAKLIREADGGVLFLDEIGDMPLSLQARLLRVLQDHEVRPLGTAQAHHVDFVLMCATRRDLGAMADAGTFRTDLYFRLQHFTVELPALRDLPDAGDRIDQLLLAVFPDADTVLSAQAREALYGYSWPGNWRGRSSPRARRSPRWCNWTDASSWLTCRRPFACIGRHDRHCVRSKSSVPQLSPQRARRRSETTG